MSLTKVWSIDSYQSDAIPEFARRTYDGILPYVQEFLCSAHPYRKGIMCPFVPAALKNGNIFFTFFDPEISINFDQDVKYFMDMCIKFYSDAISKSKSFGALIILFKEEFSIQKLLEIHLLTKKSCIDKALMLGALWKENSAQSLHNENYFPLRTPTPILVLRDLTVSDLTFLHPQHYNLKMRISFLNTFVKTFSKNAGFNVEHTQVQEAIKLLNKYVRRRKFTFLLFSLGCIFVLAILMIIIRVFLL